MTTLRDLLLDSRDGEWGKGEPFAGGHQVSVIRGTDFAATRIGVIEKVPVRVLDEKHLRRKALQAGDIIIETAGGTKDQPTGRTLYVSEQLLRSLPYPAVCASFARFLRIDQAKALPRFVFWLFQDLYERREILQYHLQHTGVARFQFTTFADTHELVLPDYDIQRRIAGILSAYDDLIEVNQRRIAILEEMARRLFDEWFVRFRYPGHEAVPLVETELGSVPEGWSPIRADGLIAFDPKTKVPKEGEKIFVPMSALDTANSVISGWERRSGNSGAKFVNGDTLMARITPCLENGKTGLVNFLPAGEAGFGSTEFTVMRGLRVSPSFVYLLARSEAFRATAIKSMGGADGRQRVRTEALEGFEFACPPADLLDTFARKTEPLFANIRVLADQNTRLRSARDLLLPKLISGEIDVGRAEEALARAAE